jgi:hypothetical protein
MACLTNAHLPAGPSDVSMIHPVINCPCQYSTPAETSAGTMSFTTRHGARWERFSDDLRAAGRSSQQRPMHRCFASVVDLSAARSPSLLVRPCKLLSRRRQSCCAVFRQSCCALWGVCRRSASDPPVGRSKQRFSSQVDTPAVGSMLTQPHVYQPSFYHNSPVVMPW